MKIITIVGARPQFVKAAMVSRAIMAGNASGEFDINEYILHTGQHYDPCMSEIFFNDLSIPRPRWQLHCAEQTHGRATARMLTEIETVLMEERPDYVLVYGDTNSTLAGALAASKLHIPVVHVEAGLRSFNRQMPEEINRVLTDHISTVLCCPTFDSLRNLANEGIKDGVSHVGDVMYDAALLFGKLADESSDILSRLRLEKKSFRLCTVHRAENTDSFERLSSILNAIIEISASECPTILPVHPRTATFLQKYGLNARIDAASVRIIPPVGFLDMVMLEKNAQTIITDSGGIQKEAYFHRTPCITLRNETEWTETVTAGWNILAGYDSNAIISALDFKSERTEIDEYGDGQAAYSIIKLL
jgi:UDP-GlcNAc3NAcA epimerase